MEFSDIFPDGKPIRLHATTRDGAIRELVMELGKKGLLPEERLAATVKILIDREELGSTGIGEGVAVPHARLPFAKEILTCIGISRAGISWNSLDGIPVKVVFLLVHGETGNGRALNALAAISRLVRDSDFLAGYNDEIDPDIT